MTSAAVEPIDLVGVEPHARVVRSVPAVHVQHQLGVPERHHSEVHEPVIIVPRDLGESDRRRTNRAHAPRPARRSSARPCGPNRRVPACWREWRLRCGRRRRRASRVQTAHRFPIAAQHRGRKRSLPAPVFGLEIRTERDQEIEDVVALTVDGEVQRRLTAARSATDDGPAPPDSVRPCPESAAGRPATGPRRCDAWRHARRGAAITAWRVGSTDAASAPGVRKTVAQPMTSSCVHISPALNIAARVEQRANDIQVARAAAAQCNGVGVVSGFARIRIGALLEQQSHDVHVSAFCGGMQAGPTLVMRPRVGEAHQAAIALEQPRTAPPSPAAHASKKVAMPVWRRRRFRLSARASWRSHAPAPPRAGRRELRTGVGPPQYLQPFLCQLFQVLERGTFGKLRRWHRPFLPLSPGVRVSRAGSQGG